MLSRGICYLIKKHKFIDFQWVKSKFFLIVFVFKKSPKSPFFKGGLPLVPPFFKGGLPLAPPFFKGGEGGLYYNRYINKYLEIYFLRDSIENKPVMFQ